MLTRCGLCLLLAISSAAQGQISYWQPAPLAQPLMVFPDWRPIAVVPAMPAPPPSQRERRIERYYFDAGSPDRALLPPEPAVGSTEKKRMPDIAAGGVVIREYYFGESVGPLSKIPKEADQSDPPRPLVMPEPEVALKKSTSAGGDKQIPSSSTDPKAGGTTAGKPADEQASESDRLYVDPSETRRRPFIVDLSGELPPDKSTTPLRVGGVLRSRINGALLADIDLGFVHAGGRHQDRSTRTDRMGRFATALEPGRWLIYSISPAAGSRRFLRSTIVELGENAALELND